MNEMFAYSFKVPSQLQLHLQFLQNFKSHEHFFKECTYFTCKQKLTIPDFYKMLPHL